MEGDNYRRQYGQSNYQPPPGYAQNVGGRSAGGASDNSRHSQSQTSAMTPSTFATSTSSTSQRQGIGGFAYTHTQQPQQQQQHQQQQQPPPPHYAPQLQESPIHYAADYPSETQRQQQFSSFPTNLMYNLPPQVQQQSSGYEPVHQYPSRPTGAIGVLSNQFGVPQYYNTTEATTASGQLPQAYASTSFQQPLPYQQPMQLGRTGTASAYPTGMTDYSQVSGPSLAEQQEQPQAPESSEDAYANYLESLRRTFQLTHEGRLVEAGQRLLELSEWLLEHANDLEDIGLTRDEQALQAERLKLWGDFNTCWLAVLQRQKDNTHTMMDTGQPLPPPQNILQEDFLERMARELIHWCDSLERHGLVDYEMGVWEEEILDILQECLDLLGSDDEEVPDAPPTARVPPPVTGSGPR